MGGKSERLWCRCLLECREELLCLDTNAPDTESHEWDSKQHGWEQTDRRVPGEPRTRLAFRWFEGTEGVESARYRRTADNQPTPSLDRSAFLSSDLRVGGRYSRFKRISGAWTGYDVPYELKAFSPATRPGVLARLDPTFFTGRNPRVNRLWWSGRECTNVAAVRID